MNLEQLLAEVEADDKAATPGPWTDTKPGKDADGWPTGVAVAFVARGQGVYANPPGGSFPTSDQRLIAHYRTTAPVLAKVVRKHQRAIKEAFAYVWGVLPDKFKHDVSIMVERHNANIDRIVAEHTEPRAAVEDGDEHGVPR